MGKIQGHRKCLVVHKYKKAHRPLDRSGHTGLPLLAWTVAVYLLQVLILRILIDGDTLALED